MAKKISLGRGFDALIPKDIDKTILEEDKNRVQKLLITEIAPNPDQPRREFDKSSLGELTESIKRHGVIQPIIVVRAAGTNSYRVVAGERRWRAAQAAGLSDMPAIVRSLEELEQIEFSLIENIQRVDLSPLEQALSVYRLQHQFNLSLEEISKKLGKAQSTISNLSRLLQLPDAAREALRSGQISEGHARTILSLKDRPELQKELLSCILNNKWTVREAERFVQRNKKNKVALATTEDQSLMTDLSQKLNTVVKIKHSKTGGQIIIRFRSSDELAKIAQRLNKTG